MLQPTESTADFTRDCRTLPRSRSRDCRRRDRYNLSNKGRWSRDRRSQSRSRSRERKGRGSGRARHGSHDGTFGSLGTPKEIPDEFSAWKMPDKLRFEFYKTAIKRIGRTLTDIALVQWVVRQMA
jgi:hypothetical protein